MVGNILGFCMRIPIFSYVANRQSSGSECKFQSQRYGQHSETVSSGRVRETGGAISWSCASLRSAGPGRDCICQDKTGAANLSSQIADRKGSGQVVKRYCAVVRRNADVYKETETAAEYQELTDYLQRDRRTNTSYIVPKGTKGAKESKLRYAILEETEDLSLVDIELLTGRHHQIRVQLSGAGMPIAGDKKYDEKSAKTTGTREKETPALCAYSLSFQHPKTGKQMDFTVLPEGGAFEKFRKE